MLIKETSKHDRFGFMPSAKQMQISKNNWTININKLHLHAATGPVMH